MSIFTLTFFFFALFPTPQTLHHTASYRTKQAYPFTNNWNLLLNTMQHQVSCFQLLRIFVHFSGIFSFFFHFHINRDPKIFSFFILLLPFFYSTTPFYSSITLHYTTLHSVLFYSFFSTISKYIITYVRCREITYVSHSINYFH